MATQRITGDQVISANDQTTTRLNNGAAGSTSRISVDPIISNGAAAAVPTQMSDGSAIVLNGRKYSVTRHITSSGEAEIYLMSGDDGPVVLKYYFSNYKPKDEIINRLHALKRADIMSPLDSGIYQDRFFEVSEYMSGGTMDSLMPLRDAALIKRYAGLIIEALKACHDHGIIHRDIKPVNIFFRSDDRKEIALGDFGISSALQAGADYRFTNSVNRTTAYAAPELFTNINNQTTLDKKVDYYALGISFLELWLAADPFKDMAEFMAMRIKIEGRVAIPSEMDPHTRDLIKGLIATEPPVRWGYEEVKRWIAGEYVKVHETSAQKTFQPYEWDDLNNVVVTDPKELAGLMDVDRKKAVRQLYSRSIPDWVKNNSQDMYSELLYIVENEFPNTTPDKADSGVTKAIYTLDRERSFKGFDGVICDSISEIARHIDANTSHYASALSKPAADLYLFFETRGFEDRVKKYLKYFNLYSAKRALNLLILDLDDNNLVIGGQTFDNVQQLLSDQGKLAGDLVAQVLDIDSKISLWLALNYQNLDANIKAWRQNTAWQSLLTLAYAMNTSGFKLGTVEAVDSAGFYTLLLNDPDHIINVRNTAMQADHWLRNYQSSSLYAHLLKFLDEKSLTNKQLTGVYDLMLSLPEGQSLEVISVTEFSKHLSALNPAEKQHLAELSFGAFKNYCEQNASTMVYRLDALEVIPALYQKLRAADPEYAAVLLAKLNDLIGNYMRTDLKKMKSNSNTFFAYYDRLIKFYLGDLKPLLANLPVVVDFERKKLIIDQKKQEITEKYDRQESGDKKTLEKSYNKYRKDKENLQFNYKNIFKEYAYAFWLTSSLLFFYGSELFQVIIFKNADWLGGILLGLIGSVCIAGLTALAYYVIGWFQMQGRLGKLLIRPVMNDPESVMHKQMSAQQRTLDAEKDYKLNALDQRTDARIGSDLFDESIRIMLAPAQS